MNTRIERYRSKHSSYIYAFRKLRSLSSLSRSYDYYFVIKEELIKDIVRNIRSLRGFQLFYGTDAESYILQTNKNNADNFNKYLKHHA